MPTLTANVTYVADDEAGLDAMLAALEGDPQISNLVVDRPNLTFTVDVTKTG